MKVLVVSVFTVLIVGAHAKGDDKSHDGKNLQIF